MSASKLCNSGTTILRQLVEVSSEDPHAVRAASRVTSALIDAIQDLLSQRWSSPHLAPSNDTDDEATPFTLYDDPFVLPPGASPRKTTPFHSSKVPHIPLRDYVTRLFKYMKCSVEAYLVALILLDRYHAATGFAVNIMNAFRLYLLALAIAAKIRDDKFYSNKYYSEVGGITVTEFTALEIKFLFCIKWDTHVDTDEYGCLEGTILQSIAAATQLPAVYAALQHAPRGHHPQHAHHVMRTGSSTSARHGMPQFPPGSTASLCSSVGPEGYHHSGPQSSSASPANKMFATSTVASRRVSTHQHMHGDEHMH